MTVTFARPTGFPAILDAAEVARNAFFAFFSHGRVGAGVTNGLRFWTFADETHPSGLGRLTPASRLQKNQLVGRLQRKAGQGQIVAVTDWRVSVAVLEARDALSVIPRVANKEWAATRTLRAHGVVEAIETDVQLIGLRSSTFRMSVTSALDTAVGADEAKMTATDVRLETVAMNATLQTKKDNQKLIY